jgi:alkylation response protein AidB-like acyl-CoA dehydrogenase
LAELMVEGRLPRTVSAIIPVDRAVATRADGGYRLTGRWPFGSGSNHAEWFSGKAEVVGPAGPEGPKGFAFPAGAVTLHDNWQVGALKGTGSQDFSVSGLFVPERHCFSSLEPALRGGPLYTIGMPGLVANEHAGFVLGVARRSIDEMTELARTKTRGYATPESTAGRAVFQADLGRADSALRAARAAVIDANRRAWANALAGEPCGPAIQTELRAAAVYCHDVAIEVCQRMFRHAGARSLYAGNVIERNLRDVTAAAQHGQVNEAAYELRGRELLDLELSDVRN